MGRRKLTKLLLESGAMQFKNLQHETPRDIAMRKNLIEILDILNSYENVERKKTGHSGKSRGKSGGKERRGWSPYGCHYYPDPRNFPSPKLETLPKEPLRKGEQYYLDLAGNIKKGPIGIGNGCYCAPLFKEIINENCRNIRKYVDRVNEKLDRKVNALAMKIEDQKKELNQEKLLIQNIKDENRNRKQNVEKWLKRGVYSRATVGQASGATPKVSGKIPLSRSKSLELVDEQVNGNGASKAKSVDLIDDYDEEQEGAQGGVLESGFYDLNGNQEHGEDSEVEEEEEDDEETYSNSISRKSSNSEKKNSMYNENFLLNYQQQQQQFYQNSFFNFNSNTDSMTTPSPSPNIEMEMDKITKSLLGTCLDLEIHKKPSPDVIKTSILPPGDLYINQHFKLNTSSPETAPEIKNSQIKYLKTQQSAKSKEVEQLVAKVQTIVNASNISSIQPTTVNHSTNEDKRYLYSGVGRVRNPLPMNIDEIEKYTEDFFDYSSQSQSQSPGGQPLSDTPSLGNNNFILLDKLMKARKKFNLSYQQQQQMLYQRDLGEQNEGQDEVDYNGNDGANISASSLV
jgi:hypothetical protein